MQVDNLKVNQVISNYKELCSILDEKVKTGGSKAIQLAELKRFCNYTKEGHKFVIKEIYGIPLSKFENEYINIMEKLLVNVLLHEAKHGYHVILTNNLFLRKSNIVNNNYVKLKENNIRKMKLAAYSNIDLEVIKDYYNTTFKMFKGNISNTLNSLKDRKMIYYEKRMMICDIIVDDNIERIVKTINQEEEVMHRINNDIKYQHRYATHQEQQLITTIEADALFKVGCENEREVVSRGLWSEYKHHILNRLVKENIHYYYEAYDIILNVERLRDYNVKLKKLMLSSKEKLKNERQLNDNIIDRIISNSKDRVVNAKKLSKSELKAVHIARLNADYIDNIIELNDMLLNNSYCDIVNDVISIKLDQILDDNLIELIESL